MQSERFQDTAVLAEGRSGGGNLRAVTLMLVLAAVATGLVLVLLRT